MTGLQRRAALARMSKVDLINRVIYLERTVAAYQEQASMSAHIIVNFEDADREIRHEFLPVAGHPDDDECTYREDGTDATYCGESRDAHATDRENGDPRESATRIWQTTNRENGSDHA